MQLPSNKLKRPISELIQRLHELPEGTTFDENEPELWGVQDLNMDLGTGYTLYVNIVEGFDPPRPISPTKESTIASLEVLLEHLNKQKQSIERRIEGVEEIRKRTVERATTQNPFPEPSFVCDCGEAYQFLKPANCRKCDKPIPTQEDDVPFDPDKYQKFARRTEGVGLDQATKEME